MSETRVKLAAKLPKDSGVVSYASELFDRLNTDKDNVLVIGRVIVDRAAKSRTGDREVRLEIDKLELCTGVDWSEDAQKLLEGVYEARTGGDTLPFPGDDDLARRRHQHVKAALEHWFAENDINPQQAREQWCAYFGDTDTPVGPAGAAYLRLREFSIHVGAVDEATMPGPTVQDNAEVEEPKKVTRGKKAAE